ncbi:MAG: hypothetical protein Kow0029_18880 [Candidatus Rifleibacteriota bacterium]
MKVEIKLPEKENSVEDKSTEFDIHAPSCEVAIDIGQVLAANQALLKNMARKMESLEHKLLKLEKAYAEQTMLLNMKNNTIKLLEAPPQQITPWQPEIAALDKSYFNRFSIIDRVFRPWKMRRNNLNS